MVQHDVPPNLFLVVFIDSLKRKGRRILKAGATTVTVKIHSFGVRRQSEAMAALWIGFAALPPDVRKVSDFPNCDCGEIPGYARAFWGAAPKIFFKQSNGKAKPYRTSVGKAAGV